MKRRETETAQESIAVGAAIAASEGKDSSAEGVPAANASCEGGRARGAAHLLSGISRRRFWRKASPVILLVPLFVLTLVLFFGLGYAFLQSFGLLMPGNLSQGFTLEHYAAVLGKDDLVQSVLLSAYYALGGSVLGTAFAVVLSYALVATGKDKGFLWSVIKFPMFLPWTVTALITIDLFGGSGFVVSVAQALGWQWLADFAGGFLYQPSSVGIIVAFTWAEIPFITYFIITVMGNITESLGEAARTLGASSTRAFINVTLPLCMPSIKNIFLIVATSLFGNYEIPLLLGVTYPTGIAVTIYNQYTKLGLLGRPEVMAMSMLVLALSVAFVIAFRVLFQRNGAKVLRDGGKEGAHE